MSTTQTHEEWLASLKACDQVAISHRYAGYKLYEVAKRTPSGRIVLTNGNQYKPNGYKMGDYSENLQEATPEVLASIQRDKLISAVYGELDKISNINVVKKMSNERLEELLAVLRKGE